MLYIPIAIPSSWKLYISQVLTSSPFSGVNVIVSLPFPWVTKSVALYWSPKACLPMQIGLTHPWTYRGMFFIIIGSLKTVPPIIFRIVPLGDFHIFFKVYSFTLCSSGVIVAHFIPTLYFLIALAASTVTWSSVKSLFLIPKS